MTIRPLSAADLEAFYRIRFSNKENLPVESQIQYLQQEQLLSDIEQGGGFLCLEDGLPIGVSMGIFIPNAFIAALFVLPEQQRQGVGSALLDKTTEWLGDQGASEILLTTAPGSKAEQFYKGRGWKFVGVDKISGHHEYILISAK